MINKKQSLTLLGAVALSVSLSACSVFDWLIYKPDVPQGNYMELQQVEKLRVEMTKEQAEYILGRPVLRDSFADNIWYYVYHFKSGRNASVTHKELILYFDGDLLTKVEGDYKLSDDFDTPLNEGALPTVSAPVVAPLLPEQEPDAIRRDAKPLVEEERISKENEVPKGGNQNRPKGE